MDMTWDFFLYLPTRSLMSPEKNKKIPSLGMEEMGPCGEKATDNLLSVGIMRVAE